MNITGLSSYSKETVGLRQPVNIKDQQFKLIYAYPILHADSLNKNIIDSCRKFQTISFLREIMVSNSLNIVNMSSQVSYQDNQMRNVAQLIGNAILTGSSVSSNTVTTDNFPKVSNYEIQNRINQKTNLLIKYIESDPRTKKLMPSFNIITLNNLIDVPVIVGTKPFSTPTYPLLFILAFSIATQKSLDKFSNVESIINLLKTTKEQKWANILINLTKPNKSFRDSLINDFKRNYPELRNKLQLNKFTNFLLKGFEGNLSSNFITRTLGLSRNKDNQEQRDLAPKQEVTKTELNPLYNFLKLVKNSLDDAKLQFKFVLDPILLKNQIGLDTANNTMLTSVTKLSSNQNQIFMQMYDKFVELLSIPGSIFLSSVFNTLYPVAIQNPTTGQLEGNINIDFLQLKDKYFDAELNKRMKSLIEDTFSKEIANSLSSLSPDESLERVSLIKSVCKSMSQVDKIIEEEVNKFNGKAISSVNFNIHQLDNFTESISRIANIFSSLSKRFENVFSQLVNNSKSLLQVARVRINSCIEDFLREIYNRPNYHSVMSYQHGVSDDSVMKIYIPQMTETLFSIFYFFFLYRLQSAMCQFVDIIDVEIESKVNDVFDFPNYTLVLPIDILRGVYSSYVSNSLDALMQGSNLQPISTMNDNYIKGMIKFLCKRINIPSIIVVDENKNDYFYQFMFMSSPEKISGSSMDAFIKSGNIY